MDLDLSRPELPSNYTFYSESASIGIFLAIGLVANLPLLFIFVRSKHIRSVADKFLFNILTVDVLSLFILLPTILMDLILNHREEENTSNIDYVKEAAAAAAATVETTITDFPSTWSCTFKKSFLSGVATASILGALEIAVERYLVIVTPLHYHKLLTRPAVVITSCIGVFIAIGSAVLSSLDPCEPVFPSCAKTTITYTESLWWPTYTLIHVSVFFILPVLLMAFIYSRIWCEARRQIAKINEQCKNPFFLSDHQQINEHIDKGKRRILLYPMIIRSKIVNRFTAAKTDKAARVSILTLSATILCWSPYYYVQCAHAIRSIMEQMGGNFKVLEAWNHWETTLPLIFASLHPVLEPLFYAYRYKRLREEVVKVLRVDLVRRCLFRAQRRVEETPVLEKSPTIIIQAPISRPLYGQGAERTAMSHPHPHPQFQPSRARFHIGDLENESVQGDVESVGVVDVSSSSSVVPPPPLCLIDHPCELVSSIAPPQNGGDHGQPILLPTLVAPITQDEAPAIPLLTDTIGLKATIYWIGNTTRKWVHCLRDSINSFSKRWKSHRESVTSTASVVTLLSSKWYPEIPHDEV